jgi:murein DD-endopeptidase MepM/ murein hydrolase activator NlpD
VSDALDIVGAPGGDLGAPVLASAAGTITSARTNGGYGQEIVVSHGNGWSTRVAHLNTIEVAVGQSVGTGQRLGTVGSTGSSTGPHLHYEQIADSARAALTGTPAPRRQPGLSSTKSGCCGLRS